jgi:hypothetical protein
MDLRGVITDFKEASGRYDLSDAACGKLIQAGQRFLDGLIDTPGSLLSYRLRITKGWYFTRLRLVKSIQQVWLTAADGSRKKLTLQPFDFFLMSYRAVNKDILLDPSLLTVGDGAGSGTPTYYCPTTLQLHPDQNKIFSSLRGNELDGVTLGDYFTYTGICWYPSADADYTLSVIGNFYSAPLEEGTDKNWWSENYHEALVYAACREVEIRYRNTTGVNDWANAVYSIISGIDATQVSREIVEVDGFNG